MARRCTVCSRPDAGAINALLGEGRSARSVAVERGLSEDAVQRHASNHVAAKVAALVSPNGGIPNESEGRDIPVVPPDPLEELVEALRTQALAGNPAIVHQYRLALAAQADARNGAPPTRDLAAEPEWIALRSRLVGALEPFAEARQAVAEALGMAR